MPLPTLEKTWQFNVNSAALITYATILYSIKAALVGFGSSPWTVVMSSNSAAAGVGDKWLSAANVVWGWPNTNPHSWIVLKQIGIGSNFQILIECWSDGGGSGTCFRLFCSTSIGFSGGTTGTRPTASDETDINYGTFSVNGFYNPAINPARLHVMQSTDGECTRWVVCSNSNQEVLIAVDKAKSPTSGWTVPWVIVAGVNTYNSGSGADWLTYARYNDVATRSFARFNSVNAGVYLACEGYGTATLGETFTFPDDDTGEWPMCAISLASETVSGRGGAKGLIYDFWWGSTLPVTGDCYPADGSRQFVQFADVILPWNGSVPLIV